MAKRHKHTTAALPSDPHGWLVSVLQSAAAHSAKGEHAITALTGFEHIAGAHQGVGADHPFDHQAPDDSVRIDTKTQAQGLLDVKKEKVGKQFTAWARAGKQFLPLQIVLDSLTESWYVVPGIPSKTVALDPLIQTFDVTEPLQPFKIADGSLDALLDLATFQQLQAKLTLVLDTLKTAKEVLLKVIDQEYESYLRSAAEDLADNPDLIRAVAANAQALAHLTSNEAVLARIAANEEAMAHLAANEEAMAHIAANEEAMAHIAANEEAMARLAANDAAMLKLLGPAMFEIWKKTQQQP